MAESERKVKLYGTWASPFSSRVEIALKMKGVDYEFVEEDLHSKSPELLRYNPIHKKVPVLVHGSNAIAESQVIIEYIDETWDSGAPIMPQDPYHRAMARFWARFIDDKLMPSVCKAIAFEEEKAMEEAMENIKVFEKELNGKRFLGGESIGFADIVANMIGYWLGLYEEATNKVMVTRKDFPSFCKWRDEFLGCGVVRESLPSPRERHVALVRNQINVIRGQTSQ